MKTADRLRAFRRECEREATLPVADIEVPLLHALHDVCVALRLSAKDRRRVLGRRGCSRLASDRTADIAVRPGADQ